MSIWRRGSKQAGRRQPAITVVGRSPTAASWPTPCQPSTERKLRHRLTTKSTRSDTPVRCRYLKKASGGLLRPVVAGVAGRTPAALPLLWRCQRPAPVFIPSEAFSRSPFGSRAGPQSPSFDDTGGSHGKRRSRREAIRQWTWLLKTGDSDLRPEPMEEATLLILITSYCSLNILTHRR